MSFYSITSLYSGSKGNSVLVESKNASILIDAGKSARALCSSLAEIGKSIDDIDAIFITHEHTDHISALNVLLKCHKIPVHAVSLSAQKMLLRGLEPYSDFVIQHSPIFTEAVGDITVTSFQTSHDSDFSVGYRISVGEGADISYIGYATDIGFVSDEVKNALLGCESVVLECNHDIDMLMKGPYPYDLKLRIKSNRGHLSNEACSSFASELIISGTKNILLAHLSEENNEIDIAYDTVWSAIADESVNLKVALQNEAVKLI